MTTIKSKIITITTNKNQTNKTNSKIIIIANSLSITTQTELNALYTIYSIANYKPFKVTKNTNHVLSENFILIPQICVIVHSQVVKRLLEKDAIRRVDRGIYVLNPVFWDLEECDQVVFRFV